jgi:hypothetical protein
MRSSVFEYSWGEASLAHLSYFTFREEGRRFLADNQINEEMVCAGFPDYKNFADTDLHAIAFGYRPMLSGQMDSCNYIFYSNIMNGISREEEMELKSKWIRVKTWYQYPVEYILFQRPSGQGQP